MTAVSLQSPFPVPERNLLLTSANAHGHRERRTGTKKNTLSFPSMFLKTGGGQDYPSQHSTWTIQTLLSLERKQVHAPQNLQMLKVDKTTKEKLLFYSLDR